MENKNNREEIIELTLRPLGFKCHGLADGHLQIFSNEEIATAINALIRPYRFLITKRKDIGKVKYLFYRENESPFRIFGSLCHSAGKRLLFFPGLIARKLIWNTKLKNSPLPQGIIDHFTIEPNFKTWHVTTLLNDKKEKIWMPSFKLFELQPSLYFWFGLSIKNKNELDVTPEEVKLSFESFSIESRRLLQIIKKSRENVEDNILELSNKERKDKNNFLHFDILVDIRSKRKRTKEFDFKSAYPFNKPALIEEIKPDLQFISRTHKTKLKGFNGDIIIGVSQHKGFLNEKTIITIP